MLKNPFFPDQCPDLSSPTLYLKANKYKVDIPLPKFKALRNFFVFYEIFEAHCQRWRINVVLITVGITELYDISPFQFPLLRNFAHVYVFFIPNRGDVRCYAGARGWCAPRHVCECCKKMVLRAIVIYVSFCSDDHIRYGV